MENGIKRVIVLKGDDPLERIAAFGDETKNAWIFLDEGIVQKLHEVKLKIKECNGYTFNYGGRIVKVRVFSKEWHIIEAVIEGRGIWEFDTFPEKPDRIFVVEMKK